jgi:predicted dehydrogenase
MTSQSASHQPERRLRVGCLGCGDRAEVYCAAIGHAPGLELWAYADVQLAAAERLLHAYGGHYATDDIERVLADPEVDVVWICTWHDTHTALAVAAAQHGKHFLIEKPLALTPAECWQIETAVTRAGVTACVGFKMRFMPLVRRAKQLVGQPLLMVGQMLNDRIADDHWSQQPVVGGGNVLGAGCHTADLLCYLAGADPVEVYAAGGTLTHANTTIIDNVVATVKFANGVAANLIQGDAGRNPYASTFFCEVFGMQKGICLYDRFHQATLWGFEQKRLGPEDLSAPERADIEGDGALLRHFAGCARAGRPTEAAVRDGRIATQLMVKLCDSIRTGRVQKVETDWQARYD